MQEAEDGAAAQSGERATDRVGIVGLDPSKRNMRSANDAGTSGGRRASRPRT